MLYTDWHLTLIFFIILLIAVVVKTIARRQRKLMLAVIESTGEMNTVLNDTVHDHREVKLFAAQQQESARFQQVINWVQIHCHFSCQRPSRAIPFHHFAWSQHQSGCQTGPPNVGRHLCQLLQRHGAAALPDKKRLTSVNDPLQRGLAVAQTIFTLTDVESEPDIGTANLPHARCKMDFFHVGFSMDDEVCDHSTFTKNRDQLLERRCGAPILRPSTGASRACGSVVERALQPQWHDDRSTGLAEELSAEG